jgi:hypothetical protein
MDQLWKWRGKHFGFQDGRDLRTYRGRHVGRFYGDEIYDKDGKYLGEKRWLDRLIRDLAKAYQTQGTFNPLPDRGPYPKREDREPLPTPPGHEDFPLDL